MTKKSNFKSRLYRLIKIRPRVIKRFDNVRDTRINEVVKVLFNLEGYKIPSTFFYIIDKLALYDIILS